jgi:hypothetical protein
MAGYCGVVAFGGAVLCVAAAAICAFPAPSAAQARETINETITRSAERNRKTRIWRSFGVNRDCTTIRGFNVRVDRLPKNGTVELEKLTMTIDESFITMRSTTQSNERVRGCFGKEVPVIGVFYTGSPGFSGFDDMQIVITNSTGERQRIVEMKLAVR